MIKLPLFLIIATIFFTQNVFANANLYSWGQYASVEGKFCLPASYDASKAFSIGSDKPCIGKSKNNCVPKSFVSPKHSDEYGVLMMVATKTTKGGAYFCPISIIARNNESGPSAWTTYYNAKGECVWLCRKGFTGPTCEQSDTTNPTSCDQVLLKQTNYDSAIAVDDSNGTNIETSGIQFYEAAKKEACDKGYATTEEHDAVLAISNWLPSGRGAMVRPYIIRSDKVGGDSWPVVYPAKIYDKQKKCTTKTVFYCCSDWREDGSCLNETTSSTNSCLGFSGTSARKEEQKSCENAKDLGDSYSMLACKNGFKPNSAGTDCEPIDAGVCGLEQWCDGWNSANFDASKHVKTTVGGCTQWRCKESGQGLKSAGSATCEPCGNGYVVSSKTGKCAKTYTITKEMMLKNGTEECWKIESPQQYKECVMKGL